MSRVKSPTRRRHNKFLKQAKGFKQARRVRIQAAKEAVLHAGQYAYIGRKQKKRNYRSLWIQRLNAALHEEGMTYGVFMHSLKTSNINLDRKILSQLAIEEPESFRQVVEKVKASK
ncbi:50S ribosomal protein L20 [Candidatus Microgenomates bacterium]|nr:50S ribosomal protein L20 [Candidatus Microgenomates bacterium]